LRLWQVVDEPYDSGIVSYALDGALGLAGRGHQVTVAALRGRFPILRAEALGLDVFPLGRLALPSALRGADAVLAHTGSAHALAAAASLLAGGVPVIRVRGDCRPLRRRFLVARRTAGLIAANRSILAQARELLPEVPSRLIYQGLADPGASPLPSGPPIFGMLGRLDPVKGHGAFIQAAASVKERLPGARFLIAGREENVKARELHRLALDAGLGSAVELLGHVPDPIAFIRGCHAGVIASLGSEAVSRAALEWLAVGRPLAATRAGCLPEYLEGTEAGVLAEPSSLAGAMLSVVEGGPARAAAARALYERRFTFGRFVDETEAFLEEASRRVGLP
jgi:glycosyltransferase involved in cell wall biosynthesis